MKSDNYDKFLNILDEKQNKDVDFDIRSFIEGLNNDPVNIGYATNTLDNSFGYSLKKKFKKSRSFQNPHESPVANFVTGQLWQEEKLNHPGAVSLINGVDENSSDNIVFFEQGFISSAGSWVHSFENNDIKSSCLSYMYDDMAYYYMAERKNRLSNKLNSNESLSPNEILRSKKLISSIVENRISKYNSQVIKPLYLGEAKQKVLVIDQSYGDASTVQGLADDSVFENMLVCAIKENPNADIIVKCHPDSIYTKGKKGKDRLGFYSHLESFGRVIICTDTVNPFSLFDIVDKVYVATSGVGFEALMAGKEVICFGAPCYAGWGLTDDRQAIPHRSRKRSLVEVFYYTYIWYTHYQRPDIGPCEIEQVIEYVLSERTCKIIEEIKNPKISVVIPVYNVGKYLSDCLDSIQNQTEVAYEVILINDASTDNSKEVIIDYSKDDPRIKIIDLEENIGQGFCRNLGLDKAKGEFILFIDSDDYFVSNTFFENILKIASDNPECDMVRYKKACERVEDHKGKYLYSRLDKAELLISEENKTVEYLDCKNINYNRHFWLFLYRRSLLEENNIRFINTQWEERPFLISSFIASRKVFISDVDGTVYRVRKDSTARRKRTSRDVSLQIDNIENVCSTLKERGNNEIINFERFKFLKILFGINSIKVLFESEHLIERVKGVLAEWDLKYDTFLYNEYILDDISLRSYLTLLSQLVLKNKLDKALEIASSDRIEFVEYYDLSDNSDPELRSAISAYIKYNQEKISYTSRSSNLDRKVKLIVHPGTTKTGSTFLQHFFELNRFALLDQGVYYPEFGVFWQKPRPHKQAGHNDFRKEANQGKNNLLDKLLTVLAYRKSVDTVVLSSEAFYLGYNDLMPMLKQLGEYFDVEVITYFREPVDWANSQYCEFVAGGAIGRTQLSFGEWLNTDKTRSWLDYKGFIELLKGTIESDKIIVRPYDRSKFVNGNLVEDFFESAAIAYDESKLINPPRKSSNERNLTNQQVRLMLAFNKLEYTDNNEYLRFVEDYHKIETPDSNKAKATFLTEIELKFINNISSDSVQFLKDNYSITFKDYIPRVSKDDLKIDIQYINTGMTRYKESINQSKSIRTTSLKKDIIIENINLDSKVQRKWRPDGTIENKNNQSKFQGQYKEITNNFEYMNFGFLGWRKVFFESLVNFKILKLTKSNSERVKSNKYFDFFNRIGRNRIAFVNQIVILKSVYGILNWRQKMNKPLYKIIYKFKGKTQANKFKKSPIVFSRQLQNPVARGVFRVLYPYGEITK